MSKERVIPLNKGDGMTLTASSAIVVDRDEITLVDPGSVGNLNMLMRNVELHQIPWDKVTQIFYTHLHFDHYEMIDFPKNIKTIFIPKKEVEYITSLMTMKDDIDAYKQFLLKSHEYLAPPFLRQFVHFRHDDRYQAEALRQSDKVIHYDGKTQISEQCFSIPLPGHCIGLHGLEINFPNNKGIIASDAVLSETDWIENDTRRHLIMCNSADWKNSRDKLAKYSWILPGHGAAFCPQTVNQKSCTPIN